MKLVTAKEMQNLDRLAMEEYAIPGIVLMENASKAVADVAKNLLDDCQGNKVLVICGKGNNGGDGFGAARWLANYGYAVQVILLAEDCANIQGDAALELEMLLNAGVDVMCIADNEAMLVAEMAAECKTNGITLYDKLIELYEARDESEKLFLFDLTMQNHGGYTMWTEDTDQIQVKALNVDDAEMDEYLTLMKASDEDFEELIGYFEQEEEKVVVCMFGDHQPKFSNDEVYDILADEGLSEIEMVMNRYKTPFIIWANYDIEEQCGLDISMNYLGVLLMDVLDLEMSAYFSFLKEQMQEYPIITVNGYVDSTGVIREWSGSKSEMPEYRMLQYNYLFLT